MELLEVPLDVSSSDTAEYFNCNGSVLEYTLSKCPGSYDWVLDTVNPYVPADWDPNNGTIQACWRRVPKYKDLDYNHATSGQSKLWPGDLKDGNGDLIEPPGLQGKTFRDRYIRTLNGSVVGNSLRLDDITDDTNHDGEYDTKYGYWNGSSWVNGSQTNGGSQLHVQVEATENGITSNNVNDASCTVMTTIAKIVDLPYFPTEGLNYYIVPPLRVWEAGVIKDTWVMEPYPLAPTYTGPELIAETSTAPPNPPIFPTQEQVNAWTDAAIADCWIRPQFRRTNPNKLLYSAIQKAGWINTTDTQNGYEDFFSSNNGIGWKVQTSVECWPVATQISENHFHWYLQGTVSFGAKALSTYVNPIAELVNVRKYGWPRPMILPDHYSVNRVRLVMKFQPTYFDNANGSWYETESEVYDYAYQSDYLHFRSNTLHQPGISTECTAACHVYCHSPADAQGFYPGFGLTSIIEIPNLYFHQNWVDLQTGKVIFGSNFPKAILYNAASLTCLHDWWNGYCSGYYTASATSTFYLQPDYDSSGCVNMHPVMGGPYDFQLGDSLSNPGYVFPRIIRDDCGGWGREDDGEPTWDWPSNRPHVWPWQPHLINNSMFPPYPGW